METNIINAGAGDELQLIDIRRSGKKIIDDNMHGIRGISYKRNISYIRDISCIRNILREKCTYSPIITKALLIMAVTFCTLTVVFSLSTSASESRSNREKYYKTITIEEGDTLWSIALEYISDEYACVNDYIRELKSMNGLSGDTIHAGRNLVVAYYSGAE